tara:strand:+ start:1413 stop:1715 length:303 start_codon:yes stop_codon:yes gene_type:complete
MAKKAYSTQNSTVSTIASTVATPSMAASTIGQQKFTQYSQVDASFDNEIVHRVGKLREETDKWSAHADKKPESKKWNRFKNKMTRCMKSLAATAAYTGSS